MMVPFEPVENNYSFLKSCDFVRLPPQDTRGSQDPQAGGARAGSRRQRHRPGAHRGQTVQPRGKTPRRRKRGQMDGHMADLIDEMKE